MDDTRQQSARQRVSKRSAIRIRRHRTGSIEVGVIERGAGASPLLSAPYRSRTTENVSSGWAEERVGSGREELSAEPSLVVTGEGGAVDEEFYGGEMGREEEEEEEEGGRKSRGRISTSTGTSSSDAAYVGKEQSEDFSVRSVTLQPDLARLKFEEKAVAALSTLGACMRRCFTRLHSDSRGNSVRLKELACPMQACRTRLQADHSHALALQSSLASKVLPRIEKSRYASALDATTVLAALEGMARPPSLDGGRRFDPAAQDKHIAVSLLFDVDRQHERHILVSLTPSPLLQVLAEAIPPEDEVRKITEIVAAAFGALGEHEGNEQEEKVADSDDTIPSPAADEYTDALRERVHSLEVEVQDLRASLKSWRARETLARDEVTGLRRALEASGIDEAAAALRERKEQEEEERQEDERGSSTSSEESDNLAAAVTSMRNLQSRLITELANSQSREERARVEGKREAFATLEAYFSQLEKSSGRGNSTGQEREEEKEEGGGEEEEEGGEEEEDGEEEEAAAVPHGELAWVAGGVIAGRPTPPSSRLTPNAQSRGELIVITDDRSSSWLWPRIGIVCGKVTN